jgi:flagellar basal-body rod protein FlgF
MLNDPCYPFFDISYMKLEQKVLEAMRAKNVRIMMQTGYYAAAGGMVTQFNRLDTIANNLANVNTAGFKRDGLINGDFMRIYKAARDELPLKDQMIDGARFYNRTMTRVPRIVESYTDHSIGQVQKSDNTFDFALSREGLFFAVKTPQGIRLTRDGEFTMDAEGKLVTKNGHEVLPADYFQSREPIKLNTSDTVVEVDKNGQINTAIPGTLQMVQNKKLMLLQPDDLRRLTKEGENLYVLEDVEQLIPLEQSGSVLQGFTERSNVNAVKEMIAMIETNRLVGMYQKVMDSQMNDLNSDAIEKIGGRN